MKLSTMFTIAAVYEILIGLSSLVVPGPMVAAGGLQIDSTGILMIVRFMGVANLGLALIAWFVRKAEASTARDGVALGFTIFFALHALTSLYGQFTDSTQTMHWFMALLQGLLAVGFFIAGKAGMSTAKA